MAAGYQVVMANAAPDPWPSGGGSAAVGRMRLVEIPSKSQ